MPLSVRSLAAAVGVVATLAFLSCSDSGNGGGGTTGPDPEGDIAGTVTLQGGGGGVAGAGLVLARSGANPRNATSAADGSFGFADVAVGGWTVTITPPAGFQLAAGQTAAEAVTIADGQTAQVDFLLTTPPPADADIVANVEADGAPRAGTTVRLFASGGATVLDTDATDASGDAMFTVAAGSYDVEVVVPSGFQLVAGEQARKAVTAISQQTANVAFALETAPQGTIVDVSATSSLTFSPATVTIAAGTTVRWTNTSSVFHTVSPDGHTEWSEASLSSNGATFTHTFNTPGTYAYFCSPHQAQGMTGVITVQ